MSKKKKGPEVKKGLDEWFATYSDMITLLFCFFVLLYASSTQDEVRFQYIFQAFSSEGRYINTIVGKEPETPREGDNTEFSDDVPPIEPGDQHGASPGQTNQPYTFESLYAVLADIVEENDLQDSIEVSATPGQMRIRLQNDVLFDGDSYELKPLGRQALDLISPAISATRDYIASVQVQGHTADVGSVNTVINDWDLSSMRATSVVKYLDQVKNMVDSEKFKAEGFAQYVPIAPNDTPEGRARNRRVEIIINRNNMSPEEHQFVDDIMKYDYNQPIFDVDYKGDRVEPPGTPIESIIHGIVSDLDERYGHNPSAEDPIQPSSPVGPDTGSLTYVDESDFMPPEDEENGASSAAQAAPPAEPEETDE
ncbi:MAG: flagellar motor protein MotB [Oscillospiraceae bacterium]|nr:flagellar motor protein MotB [Oscillospiraceae bacterium]